MLVFGSVVDSRTNSAANSRGQWVVHELEFHTAEHCLGDKLKGAVVEAEADLLVSFLSDGPLCVPGSKLPLFPYNRGWSSTQ